MLRHLQGIQELKDLTWYKVSYLSHHFIDDHRFGCWLVFVEILVYGTPVGY